MRGRRCGRLTVIRRARSLKPSAQWLCVCACGNKAIADGCLLRNGATKSCGCFRRETCSKRARERIRHGLAHTKEYRAWVGMWQRCTNSNKKGFELYGARGIRVCRRWHRFEKFFSDMGRKPSAKHSLDRIDTNGNYTPKNCRWATAKEQQRNRRVNRLVTAFSRTQPLRAWAEEYKLHPNTIDWRLQHRWSPEEAVSIKAGASR